MAHLLFDYDGTINDAAVVYAPAFRQVYKELVKNGHGEPRTFTQEELTQFLGYSAQDMWKAFKPDLSEDQRQYYSRAVGAAMEKAIAAGESRWYPGAESMLATLKAQGHTLVFLSNCKHAYQETHRQAFKMDRFFDAYYCTEDYHQAPKPEIYKTIRRDFSQDFVVIGDRALDMAIAQTHHLPAIGCLYGYGREGELATASLLVEEPMAIVTAVGTLLAP